MSDVPSLRGRSGRACRAIGLGMMVMLAACGRSAAPMATVTSPSVNPPAVVTSSARKNVIVLRIGGRVWRADRAIEAIVQPPGFDRMLMVSGAFGTKDRDEQTFNLNLHGVDGPGRYAIGGGGATDSVIQLANLDEARYLAGGVFGADVVVDISVFRRAPIAVEGTFRGTLNAGDGTTLRIEDGHFAYYE
jgi:hypothetical protein